MGGRRDWKMDGKTLIVGNMWKDPSAKEGEGRMVDLASERVLGWFGKMGKNTSSLTYALKTFATSMSNVQA